MSDDNNTTKSESFFDSRAAILAAIPHRPPFLFVDAIHTWTDEAIECSYRFKEDEYFFEGHYPGSPIVPGVILCESAMQAGAIYMTRLFSEEENASNDKMPVVGRMKEVKFRQMVRPGQTIVQRVSLKEKVMNIYLLHANVTCEGKQVVSFDFGVTMVDRVED